MERIQASTARIVAEQGRGRAYEMKLAAARIATIQNIAALIREVDGAHTLGAAALAEALVDRGVTVDPTTVPRR